MLITLRPKALAQVVSELMGKRPAPALHSVGDNSYLTSVCLAQSILELDQRGWEISNLDGTFIDHPLTRISR